MSITQEYEAIRKELGEEVYQDIKRYLAYHPELYLSDLYYNEKGWRAFETWQKDTPKALKDAEPLYILNWRDAREEPETCFIGTKEEALEVLGMTKDDFERFCDEVHDAWMQFKRTPGMEEFRLNSMQYDKDGISYEIQIPDSLDSMDHILRNLQIYKREGKAAKAYPVTQYEKKEGGPCQQSIQMKYMPELRYSENAIQRAFDSFGRADANMKQKFLRLKTFLEQNRAGKEPLSTQIGHAEHRQIEQRQQTPKDAPDKTR